MPEDFKTKKIKQTLVVLKGSINIYVRAGVSNSNYPGADECPVWSLGSQIFLICWLAYHNTVDTTFECICCIEYLLSLCSLRSKRSQSRLSWYLVVGMTYL